MIGRQQDGIDRYDEAVVAVALSRFQLQARSPGSGRTGSRLRELLDSGAAGAGFEPRIALESNESRRIRSLVSGGLGVAILPRSDAGGAGAPVAVVRLVDPEMRRDVSLASRAGRRHSPAATAFLALTRRVYEPRQDQAPPPAIIEP